MFIYLHTSGVFVKPSQEQFPVENCHLGGKLKESLCVIQAPVVRGIWIEKCKFLFPVPQILAMMVDLEEDPEWSTSDEVEEEDSDKYKHIKIIRNSGRDFVSH